MLHQTQIMAVDATRNMNVAKVQKGILDNYYTQLRNYGYLNMKELNKVVFSVLLLDSVNMFASWALNDSDFKWDINRIMHNLDCCSCTITWDKYTVPESYYSLNEWSTPEVAPHTHIMADIIGLQDRLDSIDEELHRVDMKANAGL